jgi:DNA damage-binding protein 1
MMNDGTGVIKLSFVRVGHHGHILSLFVSSRAPQTWTSPNKAAIDASKDKKADCKDREMLAIVGDLMRSISLVQYYPQYETLEEVARDFNANWTTAVTMLTDDVYLGGENWNNLFVLRRNTKAQSEEVRCRLETVGEFHLGEMCNKFMSGSLVMPNSSSDTSKTNNIRSRRSLTSPKRKSMKDSSMVSATSPGRSHTTMRPKRPVVAIGSQTLFGTADGTLGVILGLDNATAAFFSCLEKAMEHVIMPIGNFSHEQFRSFSAEQRINPRHGFVDGDLVESFLDFDMKTMELVVQQMNKDGSWTNSNSATHLSGNGEDGNIDHIRDNQNPQLSVDDVLAVIEEMTMLH